MAGADRPRRSPGAAAEADPPPRRYPFLPPDRVLGWTPYVWLVYLSFFLVEPLAGGASPGEWIATAAVLAAFLPLYFWGYWLRGRLALVPSALILLLGILSAPWNFGGSVFFVYAAAYLGHAVPAREAKRWLVAVPLVAVAEWQLLGLPWLFPVVAGVLSLLIGGINIHDAEVRRRDEALRRSQAGVERLAQVAERERIGRDLHDLLGHTLSLIALKAELAARLIERGGCLDGDDRAAAGREVREVEAISRRALAEVRQAVLGYRAEGLAAELERADAALTGAGIACRRDVSPVPLDADTDRTLAFALREATTNVLRHSAARTCTLSLAADEREVRLEVADDGRGGTAPDGAGLTGMRERLALAGGRVERDGAGGTRLVAIVPRRPAAAGARR
ncbi:MAG TPA: sensor histidine kinase [Thermoanaerobaculia bacterium]